MSWAFDKKQGRQHAVVSFVFRVLLKELVRNTKRERNQS